MDRFTNKPDLRSVLADDDKYCVVANSCGDRLVFGKDDAFHMLFRKSDGMTMKWGRRTADNPEYCPYGNEIADIEITTVCRGIRGVDGVRKLCPFCFVEGTKITLGDGSLKNIEDVVEGDEVISCKLTGGKNYLVKNEVMEKYERDIVDGDVYDIELEDGTIITATPEHPFILGDGTEVFAKDLTGDEKLVKPEGDGFSSCSIKSIKKRDFSGKVYNFHCLPNENYFANGILVHNCYKSNSPSGLHMSLNTFKRVFDQLNKSKTMTQIAFGVDAECESNPDTFEIFQYAKDNGVTPNVTVADITKETADKITSLCGAAAVSAYQSNKNRCYDSVKLLVDSAKANNKPNFKCNIHAMLSAETFDFLFEVIDDAKTDVRLQGLNAIVFLSLKQRGRGEHFNSVGDDQFKALFDYAMDKGVGVGFDSCSVPKFIKAIADRPNKEQLESLSESCESCMFSAYINTKGEFYPCSFMEGMGDWMHGIDVTQINDFVDDVWNDKRVVEWRNKSIQCLQCKGYNECQYFDI